MVHKVDTTIEKITIPFCETYRGIGVHVLQTPERVRKVKAEIDEVYKLGVIEQLYAYAYAGTNPPEARMFAATKCEIMWNKIVKNREARPDLNMEKMLVGVHALDSLKWMSPWEYGSVLYHDQEKRERVLTDAEIGR